jgi:hypothetical protein
MTSLAGCEVRERALPIVVMSFGKQFVDYDDLNGLRTQAESKIFREV